MNTLTKLALGLMGQIKARPAVGGARPRWLSPLAHAAACR